MGGSKLVSKLREHYKRVKNFTDKQFYAYACNGATILIMPQAPGTEMPEPNDDYDLALVVSEDRYEELKASGRPTHDLVRLSELQCGNGGLPIRAISEYDTGIRVMPTNSVMP